MTNEKANLQKWLKIVTQTRISHLELELTDVFQHSLTNGFGTAVDSAIHTCFNRSLQTFFNSQKHKKIDLEANFSSIPTQIQIS